MDNQNSAIKEDAQARARRRRNDHHNRDYTCGCGKSYLSYPALYTHLKQKHQGSPPKGTYLPNNPNQKIAKVRPKRLDENDVKESKSDDERSISNNEPDESIEQVLIFLDSVGNFRSAIKFEKEQEKQEFLLSNFPKDYFLDASEYQPIFNYLKEITAERIKNPDHDPLFREDVDKEKNIKKTVIYKILAYFLVSIGPLLNEEAYKEMVTFIVLFSIALNQRGQAAVIQYELECQQQQEIQKQKTEFNGLFCDDQNGEHILLITNDFILQFLPIHFPKLGNVEKSFKIFGSSDEKLKNAVYITQHLSYWLYSMKFTNSRLALYTDDDL